MVLHEQLWIAMVPNQTDEFVDIELVYSVFRILFDPARLSIDDIA